MPNNYFKFKQFTINQEHAAMKVGTDGVLLGAWANCTNVKYALDIGAGTGLIALMLAQRCNAVIDAVEIDKNALIDAKENIAQSPWANRIHIFDSSIQEFTPNRKYDLIVSNPPFFSQSHKANTNSRTMARHNDSLSANDLFNNVYRLLDINGRFCLVIPTDNFENYCEAAKSYNLNCNEIYWLKPTPNKPPKRVLIEFSFQNNNTIENYMIIEDRGRHQYSEKYKTLTKDFYLKF